MHTQTHTKIYFLCIYMYICTHYYKTMFSIPNLCCSRIFSTMFCMTWKQNAVFELSTLKNISSADFGLSWWLTIHVNSALGWLRHAVVCSITDVMYATSIFGVEVCRVGEFLCLYRSVLWKNHRRMEEKIGCSALSRPIETVPTGPDGASALLVPWFFHSINLMYTEIHLPYTLRFWRWKEHVPSNRQ